MIIEIKSIKAAGYTRFTHDTAKSADKQRAELLESGAVVYKPHLRSKKPQKSVYIPFHQKGPKHEEN